MASKTALVFNFVKTNESDTKLLRIKIGGFQKQTCRKGVQVRKTEVKPLSTKRSKIFDASGHLLSEEETKDPRLMRWKERTFRFEGIVLMVA